MAKANAKEWFKKKMAAASDEDMEKAAKAMGYDADKDDDDDKDGMDKSRRDEAVDVDALLKSLSTAEAANERAFPRVDPDVFDEALDQAGRVDATGLLKSLVDANASSYAGVGAGLDELAQQADATNKLGRASAHGLIRLNKSLEGMQATLEEGNELQRRLLKALGAPEAVASQTAAGGIRTAPRAKPAPRFEEDGTRPGPRNTEPKPLTKGQGVAALTGLLQKSRAAGDGRADDISQAITHLELGSINPAVRRFLDEATAKAG